MFIYEIQLHLNLAEICRKNVINKYIKINKIVRYIIRIINYIVNNNILYLFNIS